jgi:hypothetical protein
VVKVESLGVLSSQRVHLGIRQAWKDGLLRLAFGGNGKHILLMALLRQAVEIVAREHGGQIRDYYLDFSRHKHQVNTGLALHVPPSDRNQDWKRVLERGIGLVIDETGALKAVGDPYMVEAFYQEVQQQIVQTYVSLATMRVMQQMGFIAQAQDGLAGQVVIQGVSHA